MRQSTTHGLHWLASSVCRRVAGPLLVVLLTAACGEPVRPAAVATVSVMPAESALHVGQRTTLTAEARSEQGAVLSRQVTWRSNSPAVATVTAEGVVNAVAAGTATITATVEGISAMASITVTPIPVATVAVAPSAIRIVPQQTSQLVVILTDPAGQPTIGRVVVWSTSAPAVATVSANGLVTSVGIGTATVTASSEGKSGSAQITVVAPTVEMSEATLLVPFAGAAQLAVKIRDADGVILTDRAPTWTSSDTLAVRVTPAGVVSGVGRGRPPTAITATVNGAQATASVNVALTFSSLAAGFIGTTCGIGSGGVTYCWGQNDAGQLGDGTQIHRSSPVAVTTPAGVVFTSLTAGAKHTCGLANSGTSYCWGSGQATGDATAGGFRLTPVPVEAPAGVRFESLTAGSGTTCGLTGAGQAYCWGANFDGQLGLGHTIETMLPTRVSGGLTFAAVSTNGDHTCAITMTAITYCWGNNRSGALGDGTTTGRTTPTRMSSDLAFVSVSKGSWANTCALVTGGQAYCWGINDFGQIGDGSFVARTTPSAVAGGLVFTSIDGGASFTCARSTTGLAYCWGANSDGRLGDGTTLFRSTPVAVVPGRVFSQVVVGGTHACGLTDAGFAYCWGSNAFGQLGDAEPTVGSRLVPVLVR